MTLSAIRLGSLQGRNWFQRLFDHEDFDGFVPAQLVARRQSYVFNSTVDYGLPFLELVILTFGFVIQNGVRLVRLSARAEPLVHGTAVGVFAGAIVAIFQAVFDTTLRVAGYAMVFWFLRGMEASILHSLSLEE